MSRLTNRLAGTDLPGLVWISGAVLAWEANLNCFVMYAATTVVLLVERIDKRIR